jgi:DNA-binding MarR family transcriptional regulator
MRHSTRSRADRCIRVPERYSLRAVTTTNSTRKQSIDEILTGLPRRNSQLVRLLYRKTGSSLPRGMAALLGALAERPQRITELAAREGLAQPTVTRMITRLENQGLAARTQDTEDRRVVTVAITEKGQSELLALRASFAEVLRESLATMSDEDVDGLARGVVALQSLIETLRQQTARNTRG